MLPSHQQLVHQNPQRPKVDGKVVALVLDDLGRHVLRSAHKRVGLVAAHQLLGKAKVHLMTTKNAKEMMKK